MKILFFNFSLVQGDVGTVDSQREFPSWNPLGANISFCTEPDLFSFLLSSTEEG